MKKSYFVACSALSLLTSLGAQATLNWTGGNASNTEATISCVNETCTLRPTVLNATIHDRFELNHIQSGEDFVVGIPATELGPLTQTSINFNGTTDGLFHITGQNTFSWTNEGTITNSYTPGPPHWYSGATVSLDVAQMHGDLINNGTIHGTGMAFDLNNSSLYGNIINNGTANTSGSGYNGLASLHNSYVSGNIENHGTVYTGQIGNNNFALVDNTSILGGNFVNTGQIFLQGGYGNLNIHGRIKGDFINTGLIQTGSIFFNGANLEQDFHNTQTGVLNVGLEFESTQVFGALINDGTLNGFLRSSYSHFNNGIQNTGTIEGAIWFYESEIGGFNNSGIFNGTMVENDAVYESQVGNLSFNTTKILGDFINSDQIMLSGEYGGFVFYESSIQGDFKNLETGTIVHLEGDDQDLGSALYLENTDIQGSFINEGLFSLIQDGSYDGEPVKTIQFINVEIDKDFVNSGTIEGGDYVLTSQTYDRGLQALNIGGDFINSGSISATRDRAIYLSGSVGGDFVNSGLLDSQRETLYLSDYSIGDDFVNSGEIRGDDSNVIMTSTYLGGDFINSGQIQGIGSTVVVLQDFEGQSFLNTSTGVIEGINYAFSVFDFKLRGDFTNEGSIISDGRAINFDGAGANKSLIEGDFINRGLIEGGDNVIHLENFEIEGQFINSGQITETGTNFEDGRHVSFYTSSLGGFQNTGEITGGVQHNLYFNDTDINGDFSNSGTIQGATNEFYDSRFRGDFENSGLITTNGGAYTLLFQNSDIDGSFVNASSGIITGHDWGSGAPDRILEFNDVDIKGSFLNQGEIINEDSNYAIALSTTDIEGDFINTGTIFGNETAIVTDTFDLKGDFINKGLIHANGGGDGLIFFETVQTIEGNFINQGTIQTDNGSGIYLGNTDIGGDFRNSGLISSESLTIQGGDIAGNFTNIGTITAQSMDAIRSVSIQGDFTNSGDIYANDSCAICNTGAENFTNTGRIEVLNGNRAVQGSFSQKFNNSGEIIAFNETVSITRVSGFTNTGLIRARDSGQALFIERLSGDFYNSGTIESAEIGWQLTGSVLSGEIMNTGNIQGDLTAIKIDQATLNDDMINYGRIQSNGSAIYIDQTSSAFDIHNRGLIEAGSDDSADTAPAGIQITNSTYHGNIFNHAGGIIRGFFGIANSIEDFTGNGTETSSSIEIFNNGVIEGLADSAIAFDIGSYYGSADGNYDNILTYRGVGLLIGGTQIDMNDGWDNLYLDQARTSWLSTNGVEHLDIDETIILANYTGSAPVISDANINEIVLNQTTLLVNMNGQSLATGSEIVLLDANDITAADLANIDVYFDGLIGYDGWLELRGGGMGNELVYHIDSAGTVGLGSAQAASYTSVPQTQSSTAALLNAAGMSRNAMTLIAQHAKNKSEDRIELASLASDRTLLLNEDFDPSGVWGQAFGESSSYDGKTENNQMLSAGYDASVYGAVLGYDQYIGNGLMFGAAFTYGKGDVEGVSNQFAIDTNFYQVSLYGSYNYQRYFVEGQVGMGLSKYDQTRQSLSDQAKANFNGNSLSFAVGGGYVWSATPRLTVSPYTRLSYVNTTQDAYTESGATLNQIVGQLNLESVQGSVGADLGYALYSAGGQKWQPHIFVEYAKEFGDEEEILKNSYTDNYLAGATSYAPELGENIIRTGTGVALLGKDDGYSLTVDYRAEFRDRYTSHGFILNGKLFF